MSFSKLKRKRFDVWCSIAPLILAGILACQIIVYRFSKDTEKFEDAALPKAASSVFASINDSPIHCTSIDEAEPCLQGTRTRDMSSQAVWLGNSQLHAINQYKTGQENANEIDQDYGNEKPANMQMPLVPETHQVGYAIVERASKYQQLSSGYYPDKRPIDISTHIFADKLIAINNQHQSQQAGQYGG